MNSVLISFLLMFVAGVLFVVGALIEVCLFLFEEDNASETQVNVIYSDQPIQRSSPHMGLFLAGPSPRNGEGENWRVTALSIIESELSKRGITEPLDVYVPLPSSGVVDDYDHQIEWEQAHLDLADAILFWVPRDLDTLPGFTTNVEFGQFVNVGMWESYTGRDKFVVYGRPDGTPKTKYLDKLFSMHNDGPIETDLRSAIVAALNSLSL